MSDHGHPTPSGPGAEDGTPVAAPGAAPDAPAHETPHPASAPRHDTDAFPAQPGSTPQGAPSAWWRQPAGQAPEPPHYPGHGGLPPAGHAPAAPATEPPAARNRGRVRIALAGLAAGALIGGGAGAGVVALVDDPATVPGSATSAQSVVIQDPQTATTATAAAAVAAPSVVTIYVSSGQESGSGSGVVLTEDGYVLTNSHVVTLGSSTQGATVQVRTSDGTLYDATIVGTDPSSDLAVLRLDDADDLTPATFADSEEVQVGDVAVAIGAPLGLSNTVTDGIISATNRAVATGSTQDDTTVIDALQTDAAINPGNSGGALVNGAGEVIGINTAIATVASGGMPGQESQSGNIGVGFAIPSNTAERIAQELIENGQATRAYLGVRAQTAADSQSSGIGDGAEIASVEPGTAAAEAGLQAGDVITAVNDRAITTSTELTASIRNQAPGEEVTLTVRRDGGTETVEVTLGETG